MSTDPQPFIQVSHLSYRIGDEEILSDLSFTILCGEYVGVLGPNGGGKTTLLRLILGLFEPSSGTIAIHGQRNNLSRERARIGYVPQRISMQAGFPASVREVVMTGCVQSGQHGRSERDRAVSLALERLGILHLEHRLLDTLSGGERQLVYIARALAAGVTALILDEPTVGVDAPATEAFSTLLNELNRSGMTIVIVSHDIDAVAREAKTVLCLNRRLVCHGSPQHALTKEYMDLLYGREMRFVYHDRHEEEVLK